VKLSTGDKLTINIPVNSIPKKFVLQLFDEIEKTLEAKGKEVCVNENKLHKVRKAIYSFKSKYAEDNVNVALIHTIFANIFKDLEADKCGKINEITKTDR